MARATSRQLSELMALFKVKEEERKREEWRRELERFRAEKRKR